jgi:DNA primase
MTKRCFSSSQLYAMRNQINIQRLIEKNLNIPSRVIKGCFRFLCPLCNGFDTAVNPKTNLARCFSCEKNFNTIDLVMVVRQINFVDSVRLLQTIAQKSSIDHNPDNPRTLFGSNVGVGDRMKPDTPPKKADRATCHIGKTIDSILAQQHADSSEKKTAGYKPDKSQITDQHRLQKRLVELERQLEHLKRLIHDLTQTVNAVLPSK